MPWHGSNQVRNGIALSGTVHWMFDRGLVSIAPDHSILVAGSGVPEAALRWFRPDRRHPPARRPTAMAASGLSRLAPTAGLQGLTIRRSCCWNLRAAGPLRRMPGGGKQDDQGTAHGRAARGAGTHRMCAAAA
ncbi:HNH endonuclease [Geminicoccus flavidas]|uniref:HNH endonuclease n=1 Tax=Geminicoccus flavidas TaxID=2506407 RepID=UPI00190F88CF